MNEENTVKSAAINFIASHNLEGTYAKEYYKAILLSLIDDRSLHGPGEHELAQVANELQEEVSREQLEKGLTTMRNSIRKACKANGWDYLTIKQVKRRYPAYGYMLSPAGKRRISISRGEKTLQEKMQCLVDKYGIESVEDAYLHCI